MEFKTADTKALQCIPVLLHVAPQLAVQVVVTVAGIEEVPYVLKLNSVAFEWVSLAHHVSDLVLFYFLFHCNSTAACILH